jgi:glycine betaine/proline transport system ATP-binding protein
VDEPDKAKLKAPAVKDIPSVTEDTILEDLFSIVTANPYPIPVVSESGRLIGIVKTDDIFETISPGGDQDA